MKICAECGNEFKKLAVNNINIKYCSDECRKLVANRANKNNRKLMKEKISGNEINHKNTILIRKYKSYKQGAERRGYQFNLTFDKFSEYFQKPCYYCGNEIKTIGLDRVDNSVGYVDNNIVSCCITCNKMKLSNSSIEFINHCKKIAMRLSY